MENRFDKETAFDHEDFFEDLGSFTESMPVGSLHKITSRVLLIHDQTDGLVPPVHSERIYEELTKRGIPDGQRLLVTSYIIPCYRAARLEAARRISHHPDVR